MKEIEFTWPKGFYADGLHSGLRKKKLDLGWLYSQVPASAAGVYTTNQFCAAPTTLTKQTIEQGHQLQALVVNSAVANSFTGAQGELDAQTEQELVAAKLGISPKLVGVASTGVIGEFLPMAKLKAGINDLKLTANHKITEAILTTDTHPKTISFEFEQAGQKCVMTGFCKGSGMIHPKMATMLGFVVTDAKVDGKLLQELLSDQVATSFNQITVDGDTSTNDMVVTMANGLAVADSESLTKDSQDYQEFKQVFQAVLEYLAKEIARDGEGASKLVEVLVKGAASKRDANVAAKAVVGSNLVKAALFGQDANWGRIISALGQTDVSIAVTKLDLAINQVAILKASQKQAYDEEGLQASLGQDQILIEVDLHTGQACGRAWGCDLTYKYVQINASYRS